MANPPDPDFTAFDALPDGGGTSLAQTAESAASGVATAVTRFGEKNKGSAVGEAAAAASEITNAGRTMGMNIALAQKARDDLKAAKVAWEKAAEGAKKADLDKADKAVTDARADLGKAAASEEEQREKYNAAKTDQSEEGKLNAVALKSALDLAVGETKKAQDKLTVAIENAQKLHAQNAAACEALRAAMQRVADALKGVNSAVLPGGKEDVGGGAGNGFVTPGQTAPGDGGTAAAPGARAVPMPGTPSPGAKAPAGTAPETKTSGSTSDTAALATLLGQGQQNQQQPQAQQAQQMPTMPQVPQSTQPQQQNKAGEKSDLEKEAEKNGNDALTAAGLGGLVAPAVLGGTQSPSASQVTTPAGNGITTQLRGPEVKIPGAGASLGGAPAVNAQVPPTSGKSLDGLVTTQGNSEVGGRPQGTENRPFNATPSGAETRTSADHAGQGQSTGQQGRPATGTGGLPAGGVPVGGVGAPVAAGGGSHGKGEPKQGIVRYDAGEAARHGEDAVAEAVPGGTIAQNRPSRAA